MAIAKLGSTGAVIDVTPDEEFIATAVTLEDLGYPTIWLSGGRLERLEQVRAVLAPPRGGGGATSIIAADQFGPDAVLDLYRRPRHHIPAGSSWGWAEHTDPGR